MEMSCHEQKSFSSMVTDRLLDHPGKSTSTVFMLLSNRGLGRTHNARMLSCFERKQYESSSCMGVLGQTGVTRCAILSMPPPGKGRSGCISFQMCYWCLVQEEPEEISLAGSHGDPTPFHTVMATGSEQWPERIMSYQRKSQEPSFTSYEHV